MNTFAQNWRELYNGRFLGRMTAEERTTVEREFRGLPRAEHPEYMYQLWSTMGLFEGIPRLPAAKSWVAGRSHLQEARIAFERDDLDEALTSATRSLAYTSDGNAAGQTDVYNFRSLVFLHQSKHMYALMDIAHCAKLYHPDNMSAELRQRKDRCLRWVEEDRSAERLLQRVVLRDAVGDNQRIRGATLEIPMKPLFDHATLPGMSRKVEIRNKAGVHGRNMVAAEDIRPGDLLMSYEPYVAILYPDYYYTHCTYCSIRCEAMIPCENCALVMFCSEICRTTAFHQFHATECRILPRMWPLKDKAVDLLALRVFLSATKQGHNLHFLLSHPVHNNPFRTASDDAVPRRDIRFNRADFNIRSYNNIHYLEDNYAARSSEEQMELAAMAAMYLYYLQKARYFDGTHYFYWMEATKRPSGLTLAEYFSGKLLLKLLCAMQCNSHPISEVVQTAEGKRDRFEVGLGLYTIPSFVNHSCDSNLIKDTCHKNKIFFFAGQPISQGDELTDDYGVQYLINDRRTRQRFLKSTYYFECSCEACESDWELLEQLPTGVPILSENETFRKMVAESCDRVNALLATKDSNPDTLYKSWDLLCDHIELLKLCVRKPRYEYAMCQLMIKSIIYARKTII